MELLLRESVFYRSAPRLHNEDLRQLRGELRKSVDSAVEDDLEEMTTR
jgi:hypothetical protein